MLYGQKSLMGIGAAMLPNSVVEYQVPIPTGTTTGGGGKLFDSIANIFGKVSDVVEKVTPTVQAGTNLFNQIKSGGTVYNPTITQEAQMQPGQQMQNQGMSQNTKILLGVGGAALVGGLLYAATKKKRKK